MDDLTRDNLLLRGFVACLIARTVSDEEGLYEIADRVSEALRQELYGILRQAKRSEDADAEFEKLAARARKLAELAVSFPVPQKP